MYHDAFMCMCFVCVCVCVCVCVQELKDDDVQRAMELAAYFTHCRLQPTHLALSLRSAMSIFFKNKNMATCIHFCRR